MVYELFCVFTTHFFFLFFNFRGDVEGRCFRDVLLLSTSVSFDARNQFLCSFVGQRGQNTVPEKPEEQLANNLVIRHHHNFKHQLSISGCLMNCVQRIVQGMTSTMETDRTFL